MTRCEDWRGLPSRLVAGLIVAEVRAWRTELDWDVADAWRVVEPARKAGNLPGFVARTDEGRVAGWTTFLLHRGSLQVMALAADSVEATEALVDSIVTSAEADRARSVLVCARDTAPGLRKALAARGLRHGTYRYLTAPLALTVPPDADIRPWNRDDEAMIRLCAAAYEDAPDIRAFAPLGTAEEWREYIIGLITGPGCGTFRREWSWVSAGPAPRPARGAVLVTQIAPGVAHVAQMAVVPACRGRGLGNALMRRAMAAAAAAGCTRMTLLVSAENAGAVRLYERLGFADRSAFVVAVGAQPRVLTSVAPVTCGESTRR